MTKYKITVSETGSEEFIVEADSSNEAIELVKIQLGILEISGDIETIEE
jgi:hypothetical protein